MPVYSSHVVDYRGFGVGELIREERQHKQLTLRQLAGRVSISEAKLSNVETSKVSLDLLELSRLAAALEVPLSAFFPKTTIRHHLVKRGEDLAKEEPIARDLFGPEAGPKRHHNRVWSLADLFVGKHMEPLLVMIEPLAEKDLHFISHDHEEFMFVLNGEVETLLKTNEGLVTERLQPGDSMYFRSNLPHCHRSASSQAAQTLHVLYSDRGAIDPQDGELGSAGRRFYRRGVYADAAREAGEKMLLLRRSHGLSLSDLAGSLGIGARLLAQIESGEKAPDVELLLSVARRFRRPIEYFFATTLESQPFYFIQRGADLDKLALARWGLRPDDAKTSHSNIFRPLATGFPDWGVHPYYVQVKREGAEGPGLRQHLGQKFIYVLAGDLELVLEGVNGESTLLRSGDALFLDSGIPHTLRGSCRNPYAETHAELIEVFWSPFGEDYLLTHGDGLL